MKHVASVCCAVALGVSLVAVTGAQQGPGPRKVMQIIREEVKPARATATWQGRGSVRPRVPLEQGARVLRRPSIRDRSDRSVVHLELRQLCRARGRKTTWSRRTPRLAKRSKWPTTRTRSSVPARAPSLPSCMKTLSYRMRPSVQDMRYMHVTTIRVRPGWGSAFEEVRKLAKAAHEKANVDEHWAIYEVVSGMPPGTYPDAPGLDVAEG